MLPLRAVPHLMCLTCAAGEHVQLKKVLRVCAADGTGCNRCPPPAARGTVAVCAVTRAQVTSLSLQTMVLSCYSHHQAPVVLTLPWLMMMSELFADGHVAQNICQCCN